MTKILILVISAIFVNNIVVTQFLGICPFLGVSQKMSTAIGMSAAVIFVLTLATLVTYIVYYALLAPLHLQYLQTIAFILIIASLVQMVEIIIKKISQSLYQALGIYLPLITTNCAVLGVALLVIIKNYNLGESLVYAVSIGIGFGLALIIMAGLRERLEFSNLPKAFQGAPIALILAGILSLAFMGFTGII